MIRYSMVLPDGFTLLFDSPGNRKARIFVFNYIVERGISDAVVFRRPKEKDPVEMFRIFADGTMDVPSEDPEAEPIRVPILRRLVCSNLIGEGGSGDIVLDAELVNDRNVSTIVEREFGCHCLPPRTGWCRYSGFVSIEGDIMPGYVLHDDRCPRSFKVWITDLSEAKS